MYIYIYIYIYSQWINEIHNEFFPPISLFDSLHMESKPRARMEKSFLKNTVESVEGVRGVF